MLEAGEAEDILASIDAALLQLTVLRRHVERLSPPEPGAGGHVHLPQEIDGQLYCSDPTCGEALGPAT